MLALAALYDKYGIANVHVDACFGGLRPVVVAIIVRATHRLSEHAFQVVDPVSNAHSWDMTLIMLGWVSAVWWALRINFFLILIFCGACARVFGCDSWTLVCQSFRLVLVLSSGLVLTLFRSGNTTKAWILIVGCFVLYIIIAASAGTPECESVGARP
jgi:hypothetical protein